MIYTLINQLIKYGLKNNLLENDDEIFVRNQILELLKMQEYIESAAQTEDMNLEDILAGILDYACENGLIEENTTARRDLFDTKLMSLLLPRPSEVIKKFREEYAKSPESATRYYYKFSQDSDYIRRYRVCKDQKWKTDTKYGELDITINLSKPEKDPKDIAAARNARQTSYPKCLLCKENEGYAGTLSHPARQNHRTIPIDIAGEKWGLQYSPYVYYNEHCIAFNHTHTPMKIDKLAFRKLFDFVKVLPHYFIGSNADLPIVGGSILTHDHFQGGNYEFPMAKAAIKKSVSFAGFDDVEAGIVNWPMSVIRLRSDDTERLIESGDVILNKWRGYTDEAAFVFANTGEPHNTITPIARKSKTDGKYELDLVLRNNITTEEHPDGVYHPHRELHHIKKENIGLIEVMGLAVLPARLKTEMELLKQYIIEGKDIRQEPILEKHADWADEIKNRYQDLDGSKVDDILRTEIGKVFELVLEHAGVYKDEEAFMRFVDAF